METLVKSYAKRLCISGLAMDSGIHSPLVAGLDDKLVWSRNASEIAILEPLFKTLHINSLVFLRPVPPYSQILSYLCEQAIFDGDCVIYPRDCETTTFFRDLPVVASMDAGILEIALKNRKMVVIAPESFNEGKGKPPGILAPGDISPEQGFVAVSSACFACYVKFFTDYLNYAQAKMLGPSMQKTFDAVIPYLNDLQYKKLPDLMKGPFFKEDEVISAIEQAGRFVVKMGLVDSYFGNISYLLDKVLYISQTAASLDDLSGCIDPVPLDGSSSAGITASSELTAHLETFARSSHQAILHGHPKFSVIMSMIESLESDVSANLRFVGSIPVVKGDVGTGPLGLSSSLPGVLCEHNRVIVQGHGVFVTGKYDFNEAFLSLMDTEIFCKNMYMEMTGVKSRL